MNDKIVAILAIVAMVAWVSWLLPADASRLGDLAIGAIAGMATGEVLFSKRNNEKKEEGP